MGGIMFFAMETIYVALLNEGVDVWRPVEATTEGDAVFRLARIQSDASEEWEFAPGSRVRCEVRDLGDGPVLVAIGIA